MAESDGRNLAAVLPLDDVGSAQVDLAGRLAELVSRLERRVDALRRASSLESWLTELRDGVLDLASTPVTEQWQVAQFEREIDGLRDAATGRSPELRLADVRTLLEQRTEPRPTRSNFRTGHLTVCTLVPMRSVPHRVVCLVGLDDGVFPRSTVTDGDDVLARDPLTGERDPRSEDRQLLLDAVVSARETLVVTYTGANEHSGQPRPPAVPLGELLDAVDRTCPGARDHVVTEHPLQPFDARNFAAGGAGRAARPASFDRAALAGAVATTRPRTPRPPLLPAPLPPPPAADDGSRDVALADLKAFLVHPVRAFLRQRLDVGVARDHDELDDALPVEVDALRAVGGRRPGAARRPRRRRPAGGAARRAAARRPAAARARPAPADGDHRSAPARSSAPATRPARPRPARTTSPSRSARAGRSADGRPAADGRGARRPGPPDRPGPLLLAVAASPAGGVGRPARAGRRAARPVLALRRLRLAQPHEAAPARAGPAARPHRDGSAGRSSSTSTTGACASRCPCRCGAPTPGPRRPTPTGRPTGRWPAPGRARTPARCPASRTTPPTSASTAAAPRSSCLLEPARPDETWSHGTNAGEQTRLGQLALRLWEPLLARRAGEPGMTVLPFPAGGRAGDPPATPAGRRRPGGLRHHRRPARAGHHHPARGQRRHRQDLDHRRAGHPARGRGPRPARGDARRHLRPRRQPGAARAGARPAGRGRALPRRLPARAAARRPRRRCSPCCCEPRGPTRPSWPSGSTGSALALTDFDAATIATTHQFCQLVLRSLGVAGDTDAGSQLVEDLDDLLVEVVDDLYVRGFARSRRRPGVLARRGPDDRPHRDQRPAGPPGRAAGPGRTGRRRRRCAAGASRARSATRWTCASGGSACSATTTCSAGSRTRWRTRTAPARRRMRDRWRFVLVDEFQDTDPVQWQVLDRAFSGARHDGADRRPQAGDLRLPRRRRRHLPRRRGDRRRQRDPRHQPPQRRRAARRRPGRAARGRAGRRPDRGARRRGGPHRVAAGRARRAPSRSGCGWSTEHASASRPPRACPSASCAPWSPRTSPPTCAPC